MCRMSDFDAAILLSSPSSLQSRTKDAAVLHPTLVSTIFLVGC